MLRRQQRSPEAEAYRRLYKTAAWQKARKAQLQREPLCRYCKDEGKIVAATVCNHKVPHKGNWQLFIDPKNHESSCAPHHDSLIQSYERTGRMKPAIGPDGWPVERTT